MRGASALCSIGCDKIDVVYTGTRLGVPAGCGIEFAYYRIELGLAEKTTRKLLKDS